MLVSFSDFAHFVFAIIMDNLLCSEERSIVGDTVSVCERSLSEDYCCLEIVSPESVREEMKRLTQKGWSLFLYRVS